MKYEFLTTFSRDGYEKYGRAFLDSYLKHCRLPIHVFCEGAYPEKLAAHSQIILYDLDGDVDRKKFLSRNKDVDRKDYRLQLCRFSHKVFALSSSSVLGNTEADWLIWIDADMEIFADIDEDFLARVCPEGFDGAYLGRKDWDHSECGFVSYNLKLGGIDFIRKLRKIYVEDEWKKYPQWHDSFLFDRVREQTGWWYNLSEGVPGRDVFEHTILGTKMKHLKGALKEPEPKNKKHKKGIGAMIDGGKTELIVKTKNCVPDEHVRANIHYSTTLQKEWIPQIEPHRSTAIFCSGGPSLEQSFDEIKRLSALPDHYVFCVKHAHDRLINAGIIPWGCFLLDPRGHVQDFIENPHPEIRYFVASMCHPTTWDRLLEKNSKIYGYHAHVGAGEEKVIGERFGNSAFMIGGGCSSAMRGISVLFTMGFRWQKLYGYDCCYFDPVDMTEKNKRGEPKYIEVEVLGKKFITDPEKVAQCQDFTRILEQVGAPHLEVYGPGMVPHIWNAKKAPMLKFEDYFTKEKNGGLSAP